MTKAMTVDVQAKLTPAGKLALRAVKLAGRLGMPRLGVFFANRVRWVYRIGGGVWKPLGPRGRWVIE